VAKEDDAEIQRIRPEAQQLLLSIGSNIYQQAGGGVPPEGGGGDDGGAGPTGGSGDDVIDAEFSETK
jgi:molecular chaperone DnaK